MGAIGDDDGGSSAGAVYVLFMDADGTVDDSTGFQKISDTAGGFTEDLGQFDFFGTSVAGIGDINNDGIDDIAVGAPFDDDGAASGLNKGSVYILFMDADGTVDDTTGFQKISDTAGGFTATLDGTDLLGSSVTAIGDINSYGVPDIAVGADADDDGGSNRGAVYILFMDADGTVDDNNGFQKISDTEGGFGADLSDSDIFGDSVVAIGDINKDGIQDLAVGASNDDDGGASRGAVHILGLSFSPTINSKGTVSTDQKISDTEGGFTATFNDLDVFGVAVDAIGDINNDGIEDIVIGAQQDDDGGSARGAAYILFMDADGTVDDTTGFQKISDTAGDFTATMANNILFGASVAAIGDINNDGIPDLAVGARSDDDGGSLRGAVYVLFMDSDGTVDDTTGFQKISDTAGGFTATLDDNDAFGHSVAGIGDINNDGIQDLAVGATGDDDGGTDRGAVYVLFMDADGTVDDTLGFQKISDTAGGFATTLDDSDGFGSAIAGIGDINKDGILDIAVGADLNDDGGSGRGAVYIFFMEKFLLSTSTSFMLDSRAHAIATATPTPTPTPTPIPEPEPPPYPQTTPLALALEPLISRNNNLLRVWHVDLTAQEVWPEFGWFLYDARPVFAAANSVTEMVKGKFYWILVRETQHAWLGGTFRTMSTGWNQLTW